MSERLDRIEKNMEELFRGIRELRESMKELRDFQMQTEREIRELREGIAELRETQKESQIQSEKEMRELRESQKQTEKEIRELRESQKETDRMIRENQKEIDKLREFQRETTVQIRALRVQLGDIGLVQGEIGEELFYRNLKSMFKKRGIEFNSVRRNLRKRRDDREYDIVATNGTQVLVVEVKNKLRRRHIDLFLEERLPEFKEKFPQYKDKELLGAVGALVVKDDVARYAEKKGLFVLTQTDDGGATILNKERFKPKVFG